MISKKNLWFMTLFSIILVMAIYYISVPENSDSTLVNANINNETALDVSIGESEAITALKVERDDELEHELNAIREVLMGEKFTTDEKNDAYESLKSLNTNKGKEENLEKLIKKNFNYNNFVKIDSSNVKIVMDTSEHSYELANQVINLVNNEFPNKVYVTVSFSA